ncbi:endo-1,3(4)-beta-glucanase [Saccharomycopsis crataegensis]|uniref:glucan endo-1,3-beta-D-glucosidase n=1 Tax=Saccharomycopsis crataegensis TaxID=43959 RepID=A0AAV5QKZ8_9ASCO|nr:endo-1,3(4)-beta-glucanase [Saccharomycopsis crataegensis]
MLFLSTLYKTALVLATAEASLFNNKREDNQNTTTIFPSATNYHSAGYNVTYDPSSFSSVDTSSSSLLNIYTNTSTVKTTVVTTGTTTLAPITLTSTVHVSNTVDTKDATGLSTSGNVVYSESIVNLGAQSSAATSASSLTAVAGQASSYVVVSSANNANVAVQPDTRTTTQLATTAVVVVKTSAVTKTHTIYKASHTPSTTASGTIITTNPTSNSQPLISNKISSSSVALSVTNTASSVVVTGAISKSTTSSDSTASSASSASSASAASSTSIAGCLSSYSSSGYNLTSLVNYTNICDETETTFSGNLFDKISDDAPPSIFTREEHPLSIPAGVFNDRPYETNKFYANLFLSEQTDPIWSYPYGLFYDKSSKYGWGVSYSDAADEILGTDVHISTKGADYLTTPVGVAGLLYSATTFDSGISMTVSEMKDMSVNVKLAQDNSSTDYIDIPTVQGQGFITAIYHGSLIPELKSSMAITGLTQEASSALANGTSKFKATLSNGDSWLVYVTSSNSVANFTINSSNYIQADSAIDGLIIQVAVAPNATSSESYYDMTAGMYSTKATVNGEVTDGTDATYGFTYSTSGSSTSGKPLIFALPHHLSSLSSATSKTATGIALQSTTKGVMYGFIADQLLMTETLNTAIQFAPWSQQLNSTEVSWTSDQLTLLASVAESDLQANIKDSVSGIDTYTAGKLLDKFAYILYVLSDVLQDSNATVTTLESLKEAYAVFTSNSQEFPMMYDTKFGGVTTTANNDGDMGSDYGAGYYNDHHFHYGYFVHAAALIGYVDSKYGNGTWADSNKDWVNSLVRDVANPSEDDSYFPVSRMFDWFNGHSWAAGLFTSGAGKNEESTSEDYNFAYGMKLWGKVIGDSAMESRGDLMIAIMKRSLNDYFYYSDDNTVEPSEIVANKVSGIFYENKIAYTTFFGDNVEYIHGIHMLPLTPVSSEMRGPTFAEEEWNDYLSSIIDGLDSGWTGILRLNQALFNPSSSYEFFSQSDFSTKWLDDGQSRTWCLAFSGALANGVSQ